MSKYCVYTEFGGDGSYEYDVTVFDLTKEEFTPFAHAIGADDIEGPYIIRYEYFNFLDFKDPGDFYICYYDYEMGYYMTENRVEVTQELFDLFKKIVDKSKRMDKHDKHKKEVEADD